MKNKVIYYCDELNDDFANTNIIQKPLGENFKYIHTNLIWKIASFFLYYIIALPIAYATNKFFNHNKVVNKKLLKPYKKTGYFIYANHTQHINDAFCNPTIAFPKKNYVICSPDAFSIPGIKNVVQMLGAIPLPSSLHEYRDYLNWLDEVIKKNNVITIYPEAHIWPYYTKIRPFKSNSFKYPIKKSVPVFSITHCYQKRRFSSKPKIVSYIDGPFYPNSNLSLNEQSDELRNKVYNAMCERSQYHSTYEYIKYVKKD